MHCFRLWSRTPPVLAQFCPCFRTEIGCAVYFRRFTAGSNLPNHFADFVANGDT